MIAASNFVPLPGLVEAYEAAGGVIVCTGGVWFVSDANLMTHVQGKFDPLAAAQAQQLDAAAAARWQAQQGVFATDGADTGIDPTSLTALASAQVYAVAKSDQSTSWKNQDGTWVTLTAAQITALFAGASAKSQACFDRERALHDAIMAATTPEAAFAIDVTAGWPS